MTSTNSIARIGSSQPRKDLACTDLARSFEQVQVLPHAMPWPSLGTIGLAPGARALRLNAIGGSDANIILSGDPDRVTALWREKRGDGEGEDLTAVLPVMLGQWTEDFNRQWYARAMGYGVTDCGSVWTSMVHPWRRATLDGVVEDKASVFEAKHVSAFAKADEVLARYMPQLQHNMAVTGLPNAVLSVIFGNHKWESYEIAADWLYQDELLDAEQRFWNCVVSGQPPIVAPPPAPPKPVAYKELCLEGNNAWATAAVDWTTNAQAAKRHAESVKALKELIPEDVSRAFGHGLEARRSKSGAISFKGQAQ